MKNRSIHYRRCHSCGEINQITGDKVKKCSHCEKHLTEFRYFDDRYTATFSDRHLRPPLGPSEHSPLVGLSVFWENF